MSSFASMKKGSSLDKLTKALQETTKGKGDDRFWQPEVDKAGNGYAIIRFLDSPAVDGDKGLPFVQLFTHGFQGPGGWYIENSLTTLGENDPVSEYNGKLWNSGIEANKEIARKQKRQLKYISNILVVKDPDHPEKEGKVFLYSYGKKIFDKIKEKLEPQFEDEKRVNPFNFWEGANFKLKIRKVEGYRNYDKSEFEEQSGVFAGDDAKIEALWKSAYSLLELVDKKNFKSYDVLKARLDKVLGVDGGTPMPTTTAESTTVSDVVDRPVATIGDDEELDVFRRLAQD
jgi:hypothetical protein